MKKIILTILITFMMPVASYGQTTLTMPTYHVSPLGQYDRLQLVPRAVLGPLDSACSADQIGMLYVNQDNTNNVALTYLCNASSVWSLVPGVWTQKDKNIYPTDQSDAATQKVGIGTTTPAFKLTLANGGGIFAQGTYGSGTSLSTAGAGTRFIWYPKKAALRAGSIDGTQWDDANIAGYSIALGKNTIAAGDGSTVTGGDTNEIYGTTSAGTVWSSSLLSNDTIGGGTVNRIGETTNNPQGVTYATILGGGNNTIRDESSYSFIGGGQLNTAFGSYSAIAGGEGNQISGNYNFIGGGQQNTISPPNLADDYSVIGGGYTNIIQTSYAVIGGGVQNTISSGGSYSAIAGGGGTAAGEGNTINNSWSFIGGGISNSVGSDHSVITGGQGNAVAINSDTSTVIGGQGNTASSYNAVVAGGQGNTAGRDGTAIGGQGNTAGAMAFAGGGSGNSVGGFESAVLGGQNITVSGSVTGSPTLAMGQNFTASAGGVFAWGQFSSTPPQIINSSNTFIVAGTSPLNIKVGIGTATPFHELVVAGTTEIDPDSSGYGSLTIVPSVVPAGTPLKQDGTSGVVGQDVAETFTSTETVEPGDLLVMANTRNGRPVLQLSRRAYDQRVVGVVSRSPGMIFKGRRMEAMPTKGFTGGTTPPVAVAGRVRLKVCLENGPIHAGDMLTSSSVPGVAMRAKDPARAFNAVVGKALQSFTGGPGGKTKGMITVLVTLR